MDLGRPVRYARRRMNIGGWARMMKSGGKRTALFKAHKEPECVDEIRKATNGNFALGSKRFQQQIESVLGRRAIRGVSGRPTKRVQSDDRQKELL